MGEEIESDGFAQADFQAEAQSVLEMIQRRPCSLEDVASGLSIHRNEAIKHLEELVCKGLAETCLFGGRLFYRESQEHREE